MSRTLQNLIVTSLFSVNNSVNDAIVQTEHREEAIDIRYHEESIQSFDEYNHYQVRNEEFW